MSATIAVDLGGTNMRIAIDEGGGRLTALEQGPAPTSTIELRDRIGKHLRAHGARRLGIGVPGLVRATSCAWIPNLAFLDDVELAELFPGVEIGLGNDAQLSLLAEASEGVAKGVGDAILLAVGTGIGSAVLSGGRIVRGAHGGACSFGWACGDRTDAGDLRQGWLERHASGRALDAAARTIGLADGSALIEAAGDGYAAAIRALRAPMEALGTALSGAVGLLDPAMIVIAGGVATSLDVIAPIILAALQRQLPPHLRSIRIEAGHFGARAGLIGAAIAGRQGRNWGDVDG